MVFFFMLFTLHAAQRAVISDQPQNLVLKGFRCVFAEKHLDSIIGVTEAAGQIGVVVALTDNELLSVPLRIWHEIKQDVVYLFL